VPCLWRADLSFRKSVIVSGSRAKCSNILQDNPVAVKASRKNYLSIAPMDYMSSQFDKLLLNNLLAIDTSIDTPVLSFNEKLSINRCRGIKIINLILKGIGANLMYR
jgi:hypothetical protein